MHRMLLITGLMFDCLGLPAAADDWVRPEPTSYHFRGFGFVAEVFPPRSAAKPG
jgi:hypothetical protein